MPKRLNITLNDTLYHQIKELSIKKLRSVSNMIEFILSEYINGPDISSIPYSPDTTRSPIPEPSYKITSNINSTSTQQSQVNKPRRKSIIGEPLDNTNTTSTTTKDGHKLPHPMLWLDENNIDPNDISETAYNKLHTYYPDVDISQFVNYQHDRQNRYVPDPNDPFDPTINNPYLRNK